MATVETVTRKRTSNTTTQNSAVNASPLFENLRLGVPWVLLSACAVWVFHHPSDSTDVEQGGALGWCLTTIVVCSLVHWIGAFAGTSGPVAASREIGTRPRAVSIAGLSLVGLIAWVGIAAWRQRHVAVPALDETALSVFGGDWRSASNELWVWVTGGVWCWTLVGCLRSRDDAGSLSVWWMGCLGLVVAGGALMAAHSLHQVYVSLPQTLREYQADPDRVLAAVGIHAPAGSNARMIFENRLRDGGPTATFALANTLAGFLCVAWVLVWASLLRSFPQTSPTLANRLGWKNAEAKSSGDGPSSDTDRGSAPAEDSIWSRWHWIGLLLVSAILFWGLWKTQSRAGMLSAWIIGALLLVDQFARGSAGRRWVTGVALAVTVAIVSLPIWTPFLVGSNVLQKLPESVRFRYQYWEATSRMLGESPWLGAGPGNYQMAYHRFRVPESHEIVADPHHFLVETLGAAGWPAGALLVLLLLVLLWRWWNGDRQNRLGSVAPHLVAGEAFTPRWGIPLGAGLGWLAVWVFGVQLGMLPDFDAQLIAFPVACFVGWLWWFPMTRSGVFGSTDEVVRLAAFAGMAGLIHLSFSGGWTVPGMAIVLWLLAAIVWVASGETLGGNRESSESAIDKSGSTTLLRWGTPAVMSLLAAMMWWTAYEPVAKTRELMTLAQVQLRRGSIPAAMGLCEEAMSADPFAFDPAMFRLHVQQQQFLRSAASAGGRPMSVARSIGGDGSSTDDALTEAVRRAGNDPAKLQAIGEMVLHRFQVAGDQTDLDRAAEIYQRCHQLSPTHQGMAAQLAVIEEARGDSAEEARRLAELAVELSEAGGVVTRQLDLQTVLLVEPLGRTATAEPKVKFADEAMRALLSD
ncbi:O-antigen ligase family protein [Rhodopirellula sp. JC740]|uniref:O-antigen ligase family protein n=1 Tax=Rhodopirellula halodulae TaxID=2894198 RepID=A0ABS8NCM2_9BACT|nr:O-antigen ligase family protein [Rhodopirellula sp. JC740]